MLLHPRVVHRFAVATAVATYLLILIGGLVHGTGSSLACPTGPTCYGSLMPKMEGGVLVEHSHRLAAATVVILTLALAGMLTATASKDAAMRRLRPFGWMAVGLVFVQALLGGITVKLRLPTPISTAHTGTSLLFFLTLLTSPCGRGQVPALCPPRPPPSAARLALVAAVAIYFRCCWAGWCAIRAPRSRARTCRSAAVAVGPTRTPPSDPGAARLDRVWRSRCSCSRRRS
jgi:heme A synthase